MAADYDIYGVLVNGVMRFADNASIPDAPANADWQQYQKWLAAGHTPRPLQPGATYVWDGAAWVEDPLLAEAANNEPLLAQLSLTDTESVRPMRTLLLELAKIYPPQVAGSERAYLLDNETRARLTRRRVLPPYEPTLEEAKAQRIFELRTQLLAYTRLGFIFQTVRWSCDVTDMVLYITLAGYQVSGNLLTSDSRLHIWDATYTERILTPLTASKLAGALYQWLYLAQREAQAQVAQVLACTTVAQVQAVFWNWRYSADAPYNADTEPSPSGFSKGFDKGFS